MAQQSPVKPVLKKPPGYIDPNQPPRPAPGNRIPPGPVAFPPSFHSRPKPPKRSGFCRVCCLVSCIILLVVIVVVAVAASIFFILYDPRLPLIYLRDFHIPMFNTTTNLGGTFLDTWTVPEMEMKNPNGKLDVYYSTLHAYVSVGDPNDIGLVLGMKELGGFTQKAKNTTSLRFDYVVKDRRLNDGVAKRLRGQFEGKVMRVGVEMKMKMGYVVNGWRLGTIEIDVECGGVTMKEIQGGRRMPKCKVHVYKWINSYDVYGH